MYIAISNIKVIIWELVVPILSQVKTELIDIPPLERLKHFGGITNNIKLNAIYIVTVAPKLVVLCPPVFLPRECNRSAFLDVFFPDNVRARCWLKFPLVSFDKIVSKRFVKVLRHGAHL